ncbi:MAG: ABC transporter substrate-binding protein [Flavobacteriales bacterium]|jgi:peptide/nickel transport system substrate-binding protein|nr:ABC transporter substrate-binding protein [Flavobacteriales bacterium]
MRVFKIFTLSLLFSTILLSCGGSSEGVEEAGDPNALTKVEGGKYNGGVLKLNSIEDYTSLFPVSINDVYSTHIASLGYEGLFKLNQKTLEAEPCLAESFDIDKSKTTYTFHLRKGVMFHDDECFSDGKGREVTADDFKYCFEYLCSDHEANKWPTLLVERLVGGHEYYNKEAQSVKGIKVVDKHTLELTLVDPYSDFPSALSVLAAVVYPKEAIEKYGYDGMADHIVGTGPFIVKEMKNGQSARFAKNSVYWATDEFGNKLPFLSEVTFSFIKDKREEMTAFQNGDLDLLWGIPVEEIPNIMGTLEEAKEGKNREFDVQSINSLNVQYYGFLQTSEVFSNKKVRQAFNYAIDRDSLVDYVLEGEGSVAYNGFVPPMAGYPTEEVKGFEYDLKKAQKLMAEAGYPGGKGFPEVTLNYNPSGGINKKIGDALTSMLNENLGINISMTTMPMNELHPKAERAELDFWRFGWIADYPSPDNFLYMFRGKNIIEGKETSINYFRYNNPEFDEVYDQAMKEIDEEKRMKLYAQCDQMLIDDAVIMPLFFNTGIRLINPELKNFDINQMEHRDLSIVYFVEKKKSKVRVYDNLVPEGEEEVE